MILYNRKYRFTVRNKERPTGREWEDLRIKFNFLKTPESTPNTGKIEIYNFSEFSRGFIKNTSNLAATLEIGYAGLVGDQKIKQMLSGDVVNISEKKTGPDIIMVLDINEGSDQINNTRVNKTYDKDRSIKDIIVDTANEMAVSIGKAAKTFIDTLPQVLESSFTASGPAKSVMDNIFKKLGTNWSVQNGELVVSPVINSAKAIFLTGQTGLIGAPAFKKDGSVTVKALLNPEIQPGQTIKVQSNNVNGLFLVKTGKYVGDSWGGPWEIEIEANSAKLETA